MKIMIINLYGDFRLDPLLREDDKGIRGDDRGIRRDDDIVIPDAFPVIPVKTGIQTRYTFKDRLTKLKLTGGLV